MNAAYTILFTMCSDSGEYSYVIFANEVAVYDKSGKKVVSCPTEEEAVEYIRGKEKSQ